MSSTLEEISYRLQNPPTEGDRLGAFAELREYLELYPEDGEAAELYAKYRNLGRDWTTEVVSGR